MLNNISQTWLLGGSFAFGVAIAAWSMTMGANASTSAFLFGICLAPAIVMLFMRAGTPAPTVAEILHSTDAKDRR